MGGARALVGVAVLIGGAACGGGGSSVGADDLTVFAAASLTEAFTDAERVLREPDGGFDLTFSFGSSGALVTQIEQGAPADVIATADVVSMQRLVDQRLVEAPRTFARNRLEILVAPGNPHEIAGLADLAADDLRVVLADESVPAGRYASEALAKAGVTVRPVSRELDVRATAAKVTSGEADAAVVYATDVEAVGGRGEGVEIPPEHNVLAEYPIAVVEASGDRTAAAALIESLVAGEGQRALRARGFLAPS